jgi:hypothetical protein
MSNVAEPQRHEIATNHSVLRRGVEDGEAQESHEQVEVTKLQGHLLAVHMDGDGLTLWDLLGDEPCRIEDGSYEAPNAGSRAY